MVCGLTLENHIANAFLFSEKHCQDWERLMAKTDELKTILLLGCVLKICTFYVMYIYINK